MEKWYQIANESAVESPAMLVFPERIRENIRRMIAIAGAPERLRPHVKTHKLPQVVAMQVEAGIRAFKCATLREAEMIAENGGTDILVAYPLYGPVVDRLFELKKLFPELRIATLVDNPAQLRRFEQEAKARQTTLDLYLDLNVGMNRTGIEPGSAALELYRAVAASSWLEIRGLHIYDGHLHHTDLQRREDECALYFEKVHAFLNDLAAAHLSVPDMVCGGTPTFPVHARHRERSLSPGTLLLWDWRYSTHYTDMDFLHAAVLLCRCVGKPGKDKICIDLGHKAVGSEMPHPRVHFMGIEQFDMLTHSEEHLVISFPGADEVAVGTCLYAIPIHICPSMALYDSVWAVQEHVAAERWTVTARGR